MPGSERRGLDGGNGGGGGAGGKEGTMRKAGSSDEVATSARAQKRTCRRCPALS